MYSEYPLLRDDHYAAAHKSAFRYGSVLGGLGVGALAMYFLDPDRGRRRRALVRDQAVRASRLLREARRVTTADMANRSTGMWAAFRNYLRRGSHASDRDIAERVRARLGRVVSHPHAIEVSVVNGSVTLSGPILIEEVQSLISAVRRVTGVREVEDRLSAYADSDRVSALQGGRPRRAEFAFLQRNWSPSARLTAGVLGAGMMACAARHRSMFNIALGVLGSGLLLRAASNRQFTELASEAKSQLQHSYGSLASSVRSSHAGPA
jgi:osmotically-inducible protein OsmY